MLVLSRKIDEDIYTNGPVKITIIDIRGDKVRIGLEADREVKIVRGELRQEAPPCSPSN